MPAPASSFDLFYVQECVQGDRTSALGAASTPDTVKFALFTDSLGTLNPATGDAYGTDPFNANEVSGGGYTTGGYAMTSPTFQMASGLLVFDGAALAQLTAQTWTAQGGIHYNDTITGDPMICWLNIGVMAPVAGTVDIDWDTNGIYKFTNA